MAIDNKRIIKNSLYLYIRMFFTMGVSFLTAGVTMRVLGKTDFGLYAVLGGIVAMFAFLNGALSGSASRFITFAIGKGDDAEVNRVFNVSLVMLFSLSLVIVLLSETAGLWFFYNKMTIPADRMGASFWVFQLSVITCPVMLTQVPYTAMLIAHENMKVYACASIADALSKLCTIYLLLVSPIDKLVTLATLNFIWSISMVLFYRFYCIRHYKTTAICFCSDRKIYKSILAYAASDLIGHFTGVAQGQGINLLLNVFFGPIVNAARGVAYSVEGVVKQFSTNFMTAVKPQIIKAYAEGDIVGMWKLVTRASCFTFYLMWLLALPVIFEAPYLLTIWLRDVPEHTVSFFHIIIAICMISTIRGPRVTALCATGKLLLSNVVSATIMCMALPGSYVALRLGCSPESTLLVCLATMIITEVTDVIVIRRYIKFSIPAYYGKVHCRCLAVAILSFVGTYFIYSLFSGSSFIRLVVVSASATLLLVVSVLTIGASRSDRELLLGIVKARMNGILKHKGSVEVNE